MIKNKKRNKRRKVLAYIIRSSYNKTMGEINQVSLPTMIGHETGIGDLLLPIDRILFKLNRRIRSLEVIKQYVYN